VIDWLAGVGARLDTRELRLEGGHSHHRIVHSGDDASGAEVHRALLAALLASGVEILDRTVALDLILEDPTAGETVARDTVAGDRAAGLTAGVIGTGGTVAGGRVAGLTAGMIGAGGTVAGGRIAGLTAGMIGTGGTVAGGRVAGLTAGMIGAGGRLSAGIIDAPAVVIAAGGLGQAFATTSNPAGATGDGIAIAARAGAAIRDLEFVQFHPTVLWLPGASGQCPLITEALRGAGAVLRDLDGAPLMAGHHPRGDLAPRDVVAARIAEVIAAGTAGHVWLDATALDPDVLEKGFPTVTRACRKHSIDPVTEYIPVAPGAHYSCGGILADLDGRTTISGLYAVGEAASTGVQGANRLASNSVTEAVMAGRRAGQTLGIAVAGSGTGTRSGSLARSATPSTPIGAVDGAGDRTEARVGDGWQAGAVGDEAKAKARAAGGWRRGAGDGGSETERGGSGTEHGGSETERGGSGTEHGGSETERGGSGTEHGANGTEGNGSGNERENGRRGLSVAMSRWAGVLRDREGLSELSRVIFAMGGEVNGVWAAEGGAGRGVGVVATEEDEETGAGPEAHRTVRDEGFGFDVDLEVVEESNLRMVSGLIAAGALRRAESRGCHRRRDATGTAERPWHTVLRWDGQELVVSEEEL
jgi:aspartate oxidase